MSDRALQQPAADFASRVAEAQALLAESIARAGLKRDPYQHVLIAQSSVLGLFAELATQINETRQPISPDDLRQAVAQGLSVQANAAIRTMGWRNMLIGVAIVSVALMGGAGAGYWFRGKVPVLVGVQAGAEKCDDRPDGSRLCWIPVFERLPTK